MLGCITRLVLLLHVFVATLQGQGTYSIVFIHLGPTIPDYAAIALAQAGLFNNAERIILVAEEEALQEFKGKHEDLRYIPIACEILEPTREHIEFILNTTLDSTFRGGFWKYASERFLYLHDLMRQYDLENVIHMEYDNMLYVDLEELLPIFEANYPEIGATFDNDRRCIAGFIYIRNKCAMAGLAKCFSDNAGKGYNDMEVLGLYKNQKDPGQMKNLPVIMREYVENVPLRSPSGHTVQDQYAYCNYYSQFNSIFDAAALGQYLGGIDPRNAPSAPGFINESCIFIASDLQYEWILDYKGRKVPYALYGYSASRINNLHIHSKKLEDFASVDLLIR